MPLSRRNKVVIATSVAIIIDAVISQKETDDKLIETGALLIDNIEHESRICRAPQILRPKTYGFWTNIFPYLNDNSRYNSFKSHFRINRSTFNQLLNILSRHKNYQSSPFKCQTPIEIQVAIVLQRLANPIGYRQIEQTFGISQGSITHFTKRFLEAVLDSLQNCIRWPVGDRMEEVIE